MTETETVKLEADLPVATTELQRLNSEYKAAAESAENASGVKQIALEALEKRKQKVDNQIQ